MSLHRRKYALLCATMLLAIGSGCRAWPATPPLERAAAVQPAVLAVVLGAALRDEWQHLRPGPGGQAATIPVTCTDGGGFVVELECDGDGHWLPVGDHTLTLQAIDAQGDLSIVRRAIPDGGDADGAFDGAGYARIVVTVHPEGPTASTLQALAPPGERARLTATIDRTLLLLADPMRRGPGAEEHNLVTLRLTRALTAAATSDDLERRREHLRHAVRLGDVPPQVLVQLADFAVARGERQDAVALLADAALRATDPRHRAALTAKLTQLRQDDDDPADLRRRALGELFAGELQRAEQTLHSARRCGTDPAADYRLLGRLHRQRGDRMATFAAELLAREYAATTTPDEALLGAGSTSRQPTGAAPQPPR